MRKKKTGNPVSKKATASKKHVRAEASKQSNIKTAPAVDPLNFGLLGVDKSYPHVDKLALVAAVVLKDGDVNRAVKKALEIYDCCHSWIREWEMEMEYDDYLRQSADNSAHSEKVYTFNDGVKRITNQKRLDRAIQYFCDFGRYAVAVDSSCKTAADRDKKFEERLQNRKEKGFAFDEIAQLRTSFKNYFPMRRKKNLDFQKAV
jgi:hypothetical protein